ncbi:hypothetical protein [Adlercreutzia aquisgranensis]|uniref:hypothetical protein n=1 Tax=Adlercreutzia aquisgranensis TaxID=2941323 RepID=UPI00203F5D57|nr:hypothetical protein [Adlercreutzia aquisgranensis]
MMRAATAKTMSVIMGVGMVASSVAVVAAPGSQALAAADPDQAATRNAEGVVASPSAVRVADVAGAFAFNQEAVTGNRDIATTFRTAAATLCASLPKYAVDEVATVCVNGPAGSSFAMIAGADGASDVENVMIGCVCATNAAGGGAAANARVSGTSLQSLAARAGA